jgi:phage-related protein
MPAAPQPIPVKFWSTVTGREPVRDFLKELPQADRLKIGTDLRRLQYGWPIGMPLVRNLGSGIWELRTSLASKREVRLLFACGDSMLVLLHGFIKKTQKTPLQELELAQARLKEMMS